MFIFVARDSDQHVGRPVSAWQTTVGCCYQVHGDFSWWKTPAEWVHMWLNCPSVNVMESVYVISLLVIIVMKRSGQLTQQII